VIGNVTEDVTPSGVRLGGVASYASAVATQLGVSAGVVTHCHPALDLSGLPTGVAVSRFGSAMTTVIEHQDAGGPRRQLVRSRAGAVVASDIPECWRPAPIVLLGPVLGEVDPSLATLFPNAVVGAAAQGWLRRIRNHGEIEDGNIEGFQAAEFGGRVTVVTLSEEDLAGTPIPQSWLAAFPVVLVTDARNGLRLWHAGGWSQLPAFPAQESDPTGAGDALAAAFLLRYAETGDARDAARFGAAAASFIVEGPGITAAASRAAVEARLRAHPEIQLIDSGD